jgi:hypothetical protein
MGADEEFDTPATRDDRDQAEVLREVLTTESSEPSATWARAA